MATPREGSRDTGEGILVSSLPDWCRLPDGTPVPFTICAIQGDDANTAASVRQTKLRSHTTASLIINCKGDEPGTGLGVRSNTVGSICQPKTWSKTVRIEGHHAVRHNDEWWMNNKNTFGKLFYVENVDTHDATPQSKQAWRQTASESGAAPGPGLMEGRSVAASPDPVRYAQASTGTATDASPAISPALPASIALGVAAAPAAEGMIGAGGMATAAEGMVFVPGVGWVILGVGALGLIVWAMTRDNVRITEKEKPRDRECNVGRYGSLKCPAGEQAHHIVADYTLRYGNRNEGVAGLKRIPGLPSFNNGPAICLKGYAKTAGDEHNIAHQADEDIARLGSPSGTAPIGEITKISIEHTRNARPECQKEIVKAVVAQPSLLGSTLARTTISPPEKWPP